MSIVEVISVVPEFKSVEAELQVLDTICSYASEKKPLDEALQEVRIMSGWTSDSIEAACEAVKKVVEEVYGKVMASFEEETDAEINETSINPFKKRFDEEIDEQVKLKNICARVLDMASALALALNIPVPASKVTVAGEAAGNDTVHHKSFLNSLKNLVIVSEKQNASSFQQMVLSWQTEPVLEEGSDLVQKLILLYNKYTTTNSVDEVRKFASKFKMSDADLAEVILDVVENARRQGAQSDSIIVNTTASYTKTEKIVLAVVAVYDGVFRTMNYLSGK